MGYEFFGEKIIFPSALVPGNNNDQSLTINTSSVATNLALQTLQNGNGLYFPTAQGHGSSSYSAPQGTQSYIS